RRSYDRDADGLDVGSSGNLRMGVQHMPGITASARTDAGTGGPARTAPLPGKPVLARARTNALCERPPSASNTIPRLVCCTQGITPRGAGARANSARDSIQMRSERSEERSVYIRQCSRAPTLLCRARPPTTPVPEFPAEPKFGM